MATVLLTLELLAFLGPARLTSLESGHPPPRDAARHIIRPGREAEVERRFSVTGAPGLSAWRSTDYQIGPDRIRATLTSPPNRELVLVYRHHQHRMGSLAQTASFAVYVGRYQGITQEEAGDLARASATWIARWDRGSFWTTQPPPSPTRRDWLRAKLLWAIALCLLLPLVLLSWLAGAPWRTTEGRLLCLELTLLVGLAFFVRWWVVEPGPANFYSRVELHGFWGPETPPYGPGFGGWNAMWFELLGVRELAVYLPGALAGSLTVVPIYVIGWTVAGQRLAGVLGATVLALWPLHARLSTTDDAAGLVTLLVASSVALVLAAGRRSSHLYLLAAWLAAGLAATLRPEGVLCAGLLAVLVLTDRATRRLQLRPLTILSTLTILGIAAMGFVTPLRLAAAHHSIWPGLHPQYLLRFLGVDGGSALGPPRTSLLLTALVLLGLGFTWRAIRWRTLLLVGIGVGFALPTLTFSLPRLITARYQLPLLALAAALAGVGLAAAASHLGPHLGRLGRLRTPALVLGALALLTAICWPLWGPQREPTFRLEHRFFAANLAKVSPHCDLVHVHWNNDIGLAVPTHLTTLRNTGHRWIKASPQLDPQQRCLVYWRASSCRAYGPGESPPKSWLRPTCARIESAFELHPIATTRLPARTGLVERYLDDPVRVGFYRLKRR